MGNVTNLLIKVFFLVAIVIHVLLWPTIAHIVFASVLALEGVIAYMLTAREDVWSTIFSPSLFFFHDEKSQRSYIPLSLIFFYMLYTFLWFANDEIAIQPRLTTWIDNSLVYNYSFTPAGNNPFPTLPEVTSSVSKKMRENSFEWPRSISSDAVRLVGPLAQANKDKTTLTCPAPLLTLAASSNNTTTSAFACHAANLFYATPPDDIDSTHSLIPAPAQFYKIRVSVTPPSGILCQNLEVYRIVLDPSNNVQNGLDYPASSALHDNNNNFPLNQFCSVFGVTNWCLHFQHTFTNLDYVARIASKCAADNGVLRFDLPPRAIDVDPNTAKVSLDALIVTNGAKVRLDFEWQEPAAPDSISAFLAPFQKPWVNPNSDAIASWRKSSATGAVFFKYFFLIIPMLFAWYFLSINFLDVVTDSQILLLCIFVLFPSILLFLSMGAYLPMAGSIVCVLAINHSPDTSSLFSWWRPALFFITAACNSVQFAWLFTLVGQAGWSAFFYESSIKQLAELSSKFIISDSTSPTWIALMLPSLLLVNLAFLLGSSVCIVLEMLPRFAKTYSFSAAV